MFREIPEYFEYRETLQDGLSAIFRCPVAICADSARLVNVVCRLESVFDPAIYCGFFHEIAFEIEIISLDGALESFSTQNRNISSRYLPEKLRPSIIHFVADGYESIIHLIEPRVIYRVTKTPASLVNALLKHNVLTRRIESLGYVVAETGTDRFTRRFWLMERQG